jgi:NitT/TauT family transport system substrate-binding protein
MTDARWQKTRDFMVSAGLLAAATDWKQAYTTEFSGQTAEDGMGIFNH